MARPSLSSSQRSAPEARQDQDQVHQAMRALANPDKATFLAAYFKCGPGQYGEGDQFLGLVVPAVRLLAKRFRSLPISQIEALLDSVYNEERLLALLVMVDQYRRGDADAKTLLFQTYMHKRHRINNWNLVDSSAPGIVGQQLLHSDRSILFELAASPRLWDRRIAVLGTQTFIREGDFGDTLNLCTLLLTDPHDLLHKACGWMLREVGHRDRNVLENYLLQYHRVMPRTMLRYAIERFQPEARKCFLQGQPGRKPSTEKYRSPVS